MASKKQIHRKSRVPGIESDNRICNKWNIRVVRELLKDPLALTPKKWKREKPLSMTVYNKSLRKELHYTYIDELPDELRKWPHLNDDVRNFKRRRYVKVDPNMAILKSLGYVPKKTKAKLKVEKVQRFLLHATGKERSLKREYKRCKDSIYYKGGKNLLTSSIAFGKQVAKIKLFIRVNNKTILLISKSLTISKT
jgi:hypothetical protein